MQQKAKILEAIKVVGAKLNSREVSWLIGGSGSLLVHGLDVIPNDIDIVVDPKNYDEVKMLLKVMIAGGTEVDGDTVKTPLKIGDIKGELLALNIDRNLLAKVNIDGVEVVVHQLQAEYNFYKKRTDKIEANKKKLELIKTALNNMQKTKHDSETPAKGQQVITSCAFIHHNFDGVEKVFIPKRAATKKFLPGVHELPGGHIDFGEEVAVGLKREIKEEFGMNVKVGDPFYVFTYTNEIKGSHSVEVIYFATFTDPIENIKLDPEDHSEYGWFAESELGKIENDLKKGDDPEVTAILKGFALLNGDRPNFGN